MSRLSVIIKFNRIFGWNKQIQDKLIQIKNVNKQTCKIEALWKKEYMKT